MQGDLGQQVAGETRALVVPADGDGEVAVGADRGAERDVQIDSGQLGAGAHFPVSVFSTAMKASWGICTEPTVFIRFLPSFCFSISLRLRVMSPP